jgi:hypothetical protein
MNGKTVEFHGLKDLLQFLEIKCQALGVTATSKAVNYIKQRPVASKAKYAWHPGK